MSIGDAYQTGGAVKTSEAEAREHEGPIQAKRITEIPSNLQQRIDYDVRTDGQPVYIGFGARGLATSATGWLIQTFTYDGSNNLTLRQIAYDSWDNRASATYA